MSGAAVRRHTARPASKRLLGLDGKMSLSGQTTRDHHKEGCLSQAAERNEVCRARGPRRLLSKGQPRGEITLNKISVSLVTDKGPTGRGTRLSRFYLERKTEVNRGATMTPGHAPGLTGPAPR